MLCMLIVVYKYTDQAYTGEKGALSQYDGNSDLVWKKAVSEDWSQLHHLPRDCCASERAIHTSATFVWYATPTATESTKESGSFFLQLVFILQRQWKIWLSNW